MKVLFVGENVEDKLDNAKNTLADKLDLPRDLVLDLPRISIIGDIEINIENHRGIILFEEDRIKINSRVGVISIQGRDFEMLFLEGKTLAIKGKFKSIEYEGNEED